MVHHVKYRDKLIALGNEQYLFNATYSQLRGAVDRQLLEHVPGNLHPTEYLDPAKGFLYRFPFPDEEDVEMGKYRESYRGVGILMGGSGRVSQRAELAYQRIDHIDDRGTVSLAPVLRNVDSGMLLQVIGDDGARSVVKTLLDKHNAAHPDPMHGILLQSIATRIVRDAGIKDLGFELKQQRALAPKKKGRSW